MPDMDALDQIKQLYYQTSAKTIQDDFARAIDLLKSLPDEEARERVAVYMEGLAEMRNEWVKGSGKAPRPNAGSQTGPKAGGKTGPRPKPRPR
jgi:hypothetical protein